MNNMNIWAARSCKFKILKVYRTKLCTSSVFAASVLSLLLILTKCFSKWFKKVQTIHEPGTAQPAQTSPKSHILFNEKNPPQDFIRRSLGLLKNGRNLPPNQTNTIGSIISLLLQLGLLKIGAWEMEWSWWWCHEERKIIFQILEFPTKVFQEFE